MEFHPQTFYKFFHEDLTVHGSNYYYSLGINDCPGDYFSFEHVYESYERGSNGNVIGIIKIPLNVSIVNLKNNFKSSQIYIEEFMEFEKFLETRCTADMISKAVTQHAWAIEFVPEHLKTPEIYIEVLAQDSFFDHKFIPEKFKTLEFYLAAVTRNGHILLYVPEHFRTPEIYRAAVTQKGWYLDYIPEHLRTPELCLLAMTTAGFAIGSVPKNLRTQEIYLTAVKQNGLAIQFITERFPELCHTAVTQNGLALRYVPEHLKTPELCLTAVKQNGDALEYIPEYLRTPEIITMTNI